MNSELPLAISLMGPTASGKTALAMALSDQLPCELISVDSALIYRGMDIGTAKPTADELRNYPHKLIDILDPAESYSVAEFRRNAIREMIEVTQRGNIPVLVGGTMLYFKSLIEGIALLPASDQATREQLVLEAKNRGWRAMHDELAEVDPESAQRIHPNDIQRLGRALEVYRMTGHTMTSFTQDNGQSAPFNFMQFAIAPKSRATLHELISRRLDTMLNSGFEAEVSELRQRTDLHLDLPSMRCVGYRQMWQYLSGELNVFDMREKALAATRQLAKRQLTWLRGWSNITWLDTFEKDNVQSVLKLCSKM